MQITEPSTLLTDLLLVPPDLSSARDDDSARRVADMAASERTSFDMSASMATLERGDSRLEQACAMNDAKCSRLLTKDAWPEAPEVDVVIEVSRWSFLKRGSTGHLDFISPLPCPFNYGSVPAYVGLEGDLLDALVLGPRLPLGSRTRVKAWGAVTLTDRGMQDDKLVCSDRPLELAERCRVLRFFRFYAQCKGLLNVWRRRPGRNACDGWCDAGQAIARAQPRDDSWQGPRVAF